MRIKLKTLLVLLIFGFALKSTIFGSTQTLPKGVFKFDVSQVNLDFTKVGQEEDGEFKYVDASEFKTKHINSTLIQALNASFFNGGDTQVAEWYKRDTTYFKLAYGATDKLTLSVSIPYVKKTLRYHDDYINAFKNVETAADAGALAGFGIPDSSVIPLPPKEAKGHGIGDIKIGAKYNFNKNWALAFAYQGGLLKTGNDSTELKAVSDNQEQLTTGYMADYTTLALYYDHYIGKQAISFLTAYQHSSIGHEGTLDNDFLIDSGDTFTFKVSSGVKLSKHFELLPSITYIQTGYDQMKDATTGEWDRIDDSESAAVLGGLKLTYKPYIFFNAWIGYDVTLSEEVARGEYDYPGRLYIPEIISFGITLYAK
jgi:hypothetical protein